MSEHGSLMAEAHEFQALDTTPPWHMRQQLLVVAAVVVFFFWVFSLGRRERSLPPGPPTLPVLGNLHQTSGSDLHTRFTRWSRQYGGIFSLKNGPFSWSSGSTTIVLTDRVAIKQLLDRKGSNYADRPDSYVLNELITGGHHLLPMRYGERWRKLRRVIQQELLSEAYCDKNHQSLQDAEATQMLADFMRDPAGFKQHPKRFSASVMTSIVFGVRMTAADVQLLKTMDQLFIDLVSTTVVGASPPVEQVPLFKYLPDFLWKNWHSKAIAVSRRLHAFYGGLIARVRARRTGPTLGSDSGISCFIDRVLDQQERYDVTDRELLFLVGTLLEGGSDTSSATLQVFLEAMFRYPAAQRRAQEQIDTQFDATTPPRWADYERLPYVSQVIKETIRWRTISPLAFLHATTNEDQYAGYHIPARATVIINVYGLHMDPKHFPDPDEFRPERFDGLTAPAGVLANATDPVTGRDHYGYGAGRRICPGIHLAERNLFVAVAKLLWAFEFERVEQEDGGNDRSSKKEAEPTFEGPDGMRCRIKLRSRDKGRTIMRELEKAREVFVKYEEEK